MGGRVGAPHLRGGACGRPPQAGRRSELGGAPPSAFPEVSFFWGREETFLEEPPSPWGVGSEGGEPPTLGGEFPWNTDYKVLICVP